MAQSYQRFGSGGSPIVVFANAFAITHLPETSFYHYHVVITQLDPEKGSRVMKPGQRYSEIIEKMQDQHSQDFQPRASYDGMSNLYRTQPLQRTTFQVRMSRNLQSNRGVFEVSLTPVNQIRPEDFTALTKYKPGFNAPTNASTVPVSVLQVLVSQSPHIRHNYLANAKSFYIKNNRAPTLGPGLILLSGYFQSVRPVIDRFVINIDTTHAAFYKGGDLMTVAMELFRCQSPRELQAACRNEANWRKLRNFLKGLHVIPLIPRGSTKKILIRDLEINAGRFEFPKGDQMHTVMEHYEHHHNERLRYPDLPGVRTRDGAVFPFEICRVVQGQRYKKKLSPEETATFIGLTKSKPQERIRGIQEGVGPEVLGYANAPHLAGVGMRVNPQPMSIAARQLEPPDVLYADRKETPRNGGWNLLRRRFIQPAKIKRWAVVAFIPMPERVAHAMDAFIRDLRTNLMNLGIEVPTENPNVEWRFIGNQTDVQASLNHAARSTAVMGRRSDGTEGPIPPSLIIALLPRDAGPLRNEIKYWSNHVAGIPVQHVREGKWERSNDQYRNNLALKINARCGGVNSIVDTKVMEVVRNSLIIGCDVSHPAPGANDRPSVASMVASMDANATRYWAHACCQNPRQEMIDKMGWMLEGAFHNMKLAGRQPPDHVIIFRDGVSEGEYATVVEQEISQVRKVLGKFEAIIKKKISLTFIVVTKRHHLRFFPQNGAQGDRNGNCLPGLVVDKDIGHPHMVDFYLQSQAAIIGTARPSHYVVLANDPMAPVDAIQALAYQLCFVYAPATRSVSIPAPVYYADRVCLRAAETAFHRGTDLPEWDASTEASGQFTEQMLEKWNAAMKDNKLASRMWFV